MDCLKRANLSDTANRENWLCLAKAYAASRQFVMANQCLNQHQRMCPPGQHDDCAPLLAVLKDTPSCSLSEQKLREGLIERL